MDRCLGTFVNRALLSCECVDLTIPLIKSVKAATSAFVAVPV